MQRSVSKPRMRLSQAALVGCTDMWPTSTAAECRADNRDTPAIMSYPVNKNLFYSAPSQPLAKATPATPAVDESYQEPAAEELLAPPDFKAFFTLIEDPDTGEHHHPRVHYVFSDDDTEILTSATLEAIDKEGEPSRSATHSDEAEERFVIIDMATDGKTVTSASSLSPEWQALKTNITQAPSWGDDSRSVDRGLMLKISGKAAPMLGAFKGRKRLQEQVRNLDNLVTEFNERLDSLNEVLGRTQTTTNELQTTK